MAADRQEPAAARLAEEIRRLRKHEGLSDHEVAARVGYSRQYVSMAQRVGKNLPSQDLVTALDNVLGADGQLIGLRTLAKQEQTRLRRIVTEPPDDDRVVQASALVESSQTEWLRIRNAPGVRGRELTELAAWLYPEAQRGPGGHVLADPGWLLDEPMELDGLGLSWAGAQVATPPLEPVDHVLPLTDRGRRYPNYSRAVRDLVRPRLLENRLSYRLLGIEPGRELSFGVTSFFDTFDMKQSVAHEFKAAWLAAGRSLPDWDALPLRTAIGDPFDPHRLLMSPGISTLTIRRGRDGEHRFVLHERDGGKVADGGGLCHVMPAGEFQPSSVDPTDVYNDFSLWRNIMREFSEEFLGNPEHDGSSPRPIDYETEEPFRSFERFRNSGHIRMWHCGLAIEPLELGAVQLTVAVIDEAAFDELFANLVRTNDEGEVVGGHGRAYLPFTGEVIERLNPRLSASALTLLRMAWRDRARLLG
ncbi:helix-turn-helix domain-containing protein [Lentzea albidocapillata]|uniref:Transcriptional regulator, contains XRE-family HTH domain n=1 Tax=Lentzea albidocapillata TaxID=40571 RepID=A0A1W2FKP2_9PSEU|nr:helix-turn-helix domain-containing protein [Lentzea albidocapillata]SMD22501.1 Transcriptional regulator, contains XRE-family HTH domain [Lentzea albidocapillata]